MGIRSSWVLAVIAFAALTGTTAGVAQGPAQGLSLKIETERPSYALGEPIYLIVRVLNQGTAEAKLMPLLSPEDGLLAISVRDPAGQGIGFEPLAARDRDTSPVALGPGRQLATTFPIFFGATGWLFQAPGAYTVRAQFDVLSGAGEPRLIQAEPLVVTIRDEGAEGARVLMNGNSASIEAGSFLVWGSGDHLVEGMEHLNQFERHNPTSPAADHYRVALGRSWARPFKNYKLGMVRPAEYSRALTELVRARDEVLPTVLRIEKYLAQATSFFGTGRRPEAVDALRRARALVDERPELAEFGEQVERLERASNSDQYR